MGLINMSYLVTLNQRVPGSSPGAPTTQLIENLNTFASGTGHARSWSPERFQRGSKSAP
jgi:hypothetical protein